MISNFMLALLGEGEMCTGEHITSLIQTNLVELGKEDPKITVNREADEIIRTSINPLIND